MICHENLMDKSTTRNMTINYLTFYMRIIQGEKMNLNQLFDK